MDWKRISIAVAVVITTFAVSGPILSTQLPLKINALTALYNAITDKGSISDENSADSVRNFSTLPERPAAPVTDWDIPKDFWSSTRQEPLPVGNMQ
jgi:hypothetical protein